jgi:hypothetical protein
MPKNSPNPAVLKQAADIIKLGKGIIKYRDGDEEAVLDLLEAGNVEYELYAYGGVRYATVKRKVPE